MRAAVIDSYDRPPGLGEFEDPSADRGALVEVSVAGLNPVDKAIAAGKFPGREPPLPSVAGLEGVGTLDGRRVYFDASIAPFGSMAERTAIDPEVAIDVPDGVDDGLAVSFGISGLAAWLALTWRGELSAGETVLVLGASGVVGQIAVQGARLLGAGRVVAAARGEDGLRRVRELGADEVVVLDEGEDLGERLEVAGGGGFDLVIDPVWGRPAMAAIGALNLEGRLVQVGHAAAATADLPARLFRDKLARIVGHTNFRASAELKRKAFTAMCDHAAAGELSVPVEAIPLAELDSAWQQESSHKKTVLEAR